MTILNPLLIEKQKLNEEDVAELECLHNAREVLFEEMEGLDPEFEEDLPLLKTYVVLLESLEFNMQRVWKFDQTRERHTWWYRAPHCTCPKMDNADPIMSARGRIINGTCPLHGFIK